MGISVGTGQNSTCGTHMLTDKAIQAAKPSERPYKLADGEGLTLLVKPNGSKLWRFRYRHDGREKMLGFGTYPDTSAKLGECNIRMPNHGMPCEALLTQHVQARIVMRIHCF